MSPDCRTFRAALAEALAHPDASGRRALGWHEHLALCGDCRDLLEAEEALDELLASLPEPRLPRDLAARVLARLADERGGGTGPGRDDALERLLDAEPEPDVPAGLSGRVLAGLASERVATAGGDALDRVLAHLPEPEMPVGLAADVLRGLAAERVPRGRLLHFPLRRLAAAGAAALLLGSAVLFWTGRGGSEEEIDPELLASLEILENWEAVTSEDLDLLLSDLDPGDLVLLEHGGESDDAGEEASGG
jgi:hypothetical protein